MTLCEEVCHWIWAFDFKNPYIPGCVCLMIVSQDVRSQLQRHACPSAARLPSVVVIDSNPLKPQSPNKLFYKLLGHGVLSKQ